MLRGLYRWLIRLHPPHFREPYGEEMLSIYDESDRRVWLFPDAMRSVLRQRFLRTAQPQIPAAARAGDAVPLFAAVDTPGLRGRLIGQGIVATLIAWYALGIVISAGGQSPRPEWAGARMLPDNWTAGAFATQDEPAGASAVSGPGGDDEVSRMDDGAWGSLINALVAQFATYDVIALGEWHGSSQDAEVRLRLIREPRFAATARFIVVEWANASHQRTLDRFVRGESVPPEEVRRIWRDITTPGGADAPVYERFLNEVRLINQRLPRGRALRVLAADPPIDWSVIKTRDQWREIAGRRDSFAAELIARQVLSRGEKALVIAGSGHLWQNNRVVREPNLASRLKERFPGKLLTVSRLAAGQSADARGALPRLVLLHDDPLGDSKAVDAMDLPVRLFAEHVALRDVVDAVILAHPEKPATTLAHTPADPGYEAERQRRRAVIQPR